MSDLERLEEIILQRKERVNRSKKEYAGWNVIESVRDSEQRASELDIVLDMIRQLKED